MSKPMLVTCRLSCCCWITGRSIEFGSAIGSGNLGDLVPRVLEKAAVLRPGDGDERCDLHGAETDGA